ncbi:hypothetical protein D3C71_1801780 [compost metagenome]
MLLPATDERGAVAMEERIISLLELNNQFYPGHTIRLAMGHAVGHEGASMEAVVHRADQSMYSDKLRFYEDRERDRRLASTST